MKERKPEKASKGVILSAATIIAMVVIFTLLVIGPLTMLFFLKIHLVKTVVFEYNYDNAQQGLQMLMYSTHDLDGGNRRASKIVGEYLTVGRDDSDIDFLDDYLDMMTEKVQRIRIFECYSLDSERGVLAEKKCDGRQPTEHIGTSFITTPAGVSELELAIE